MLHWIHSNSLFWKSEGFSWTSNDIQETTRIEMWLVALEGSHISSIVECFFNIYVNFDPCRAFKRRFAYMLRRYNLVLHEVSFSIYVYIKRYFQKENWKIGTVINRYFTIKII